MRFYAEWKGKQFKAEWCVIDMETDTELICGVGRRIATTIATLLNEDDKDD